MEKKIKNYKDLEEFLKNYYNLYQNNSPKYGKTGVGFKKNEYILEKLGHPEKKIKSVNVIGTSGKGSTSNFLFNLLKTENIKIGMITSPHLMDIRERIKINDELISKDDLIDCVNKIIPILNELKEENYAISDFEMMYFVGLYYFVKKDVKFLVLEAGMGGKYDYSRVCNNIITVITNVGIDHTAFLGKTKPTILRDKMLGAENSKYIISGITQKILKEILIEHCLINNKEVFFIKDNFYPENIFLTELNTKFDYVDKKYNIKNIKLDLLGKFQAINATIALKTYFKLKELGILNKKINENKIKEALNSCFFGARLEIVNKKPLIIVDGAHNEHKMGALYKSLKKIYGSRKFLCILALKSNKDAKKILKKIKPIVDKFIFTEFSTTKSFTVKDLGNIAKDLEIENFSKRKNLKKAIKMGKKKGKDENLPLLITGSLYLAREVKNDLK
ncbi:hypothetical protein K9M42_00285 [Patescibacteria group bacterium]|nr:hypothetical protein [Patescibacteria group bacterium]